MEMAYRLFQASKRFDEDFGDLMREAAADPDRWAFLRATESDITAGVGLCLITPPVLFLRLLSGSDFFSWVQEIDDQLIAWTKSVGCNCIKSFGRLGWLRKLPVGWEANSIELIKRID